MKYKLCAAFAIAASFSAAAQPFKKWDKSVSVTPYALQHPGKYAAAHFRLTKNNFTLYGGLGYHFNSSKLNNRAGNIYYHSGFATGLSQHLMPQLGFQYEIPVFKDAVRFYGYFDMGYSKMNYRRSVTTYGNEGDTAVYSSSYPGSVGLVSINLGLGTEVILNRSFSLFARAGLSTAAVRSPFNTLGFSIDGLEGVGFATGINFYFNKNKKNNA